MVKDNIEIEQSMEQVEEFLAENKINNKKNLKAVALLSGGLDSTIATKLMKDKGIEIEALNFHTAFCNCTKHGCKFESRQVAKEIDIPLKVLSVTKDYMDVIRNPKYGYGSAMNPCIDCRIFMFKKAKERMEEIGASFVITGEVLGQRPMSQTKHNMALIEKESGLAGKILRPLSIKKQDGLDQELQENLNLDDLPNISGRSRKEQLKIVEELDIEHFSCPSGGCLLTEKTFSDRLKDHFAYNEEDDINDVKLLKTGRHYRLSPNTKLIVARDESESKKLVHYKHVGMLMEPEVKGPNSLLCSKDLTDEELELAAKIMGRYCVEEDNTNITYYQGENKKVIQVVPFKHDETVEYRI